MIRKEECMRESVSQPVMVPVYFAVVSMRLSSTGQKTEALERILRPTCIVFLRLPTRWSTSLVDVLYCLLPFAPLHSYLLGNMYYMYSEHSADGNSRVIYHAGD
mmetsp:Transcript_11621/g.27959  ORF Transcript_11621/g.27959 Transcript_11621/m.27959 type:complete len:104 (-) Transcript_11621:97-408(-)